MPPIFDLHFALRVEYGSPQRRSCAPRDTTRPTRSVSSFLVTSPIVVLLSLHALPKCCGFPQCPGGLPRYTPFFHQYLHDIELYPHLAQPFPFTPAYSSSRVSPCLWAHHHSYLGRLVLSERARARRRRAPASEPVCMSKASQSHSVPVLTSITRKAESRKGISRDNQLALNFVPPFIVLSLGRLRLV